MCNFETFFKYKDKIKGLVQDYGISIDNALEIPQSFTNPDSKVHGANMGPTWVLSAPDGPHEPCYQGSHRNVVEYHVYNMAKSFSRLTDIEPFCLSFRVLTPSLTYP